MPWELLKSPRSPEAVNWAFQIWEVPSWKAQFTHPHNFSKKFFHPGTCGKDSNLKRNIKI